MFTGISAYLSMAVLIWWAYCGYIWLLFLFYAISPARCTTCALDKHPKLAILIPCYNELSMVSQKVANTLALSYPKELVHVYFLDGCSSDATTKALHELTDAIPDWQVIETGVRGKINQLNMGLNLLSPEVEIVINTDMDANIEADTLEKIVQAFSSDENVGVVGANICPGECMAIEKDFWEGQNTLRILESTVYSSSIVVAPCYAFRRSLLQQFPTDCVADDIFIAFKANTLGMRTQYIVEAKGKELRCPTTLENFINHKFRKGNAFLQELLRELYMLPRMTAWWKVIFLTKLIQLAIIPWILPYFFLSTLSFLLSGGDQFSLAVLCCGFLALSMVLSSISVNRFKKVHFNGNRQRGFYVLIPFVITNLIMIIVGLTYPFFNQNSVYSKIEEKTVKKSVQPKVTKLKSV